jgi:hypothetical protein
VSTIAGWTPLLIGVALRLRGIVIATGAASSLALIVTGTVLSVGGAIAGMLRTFHPESGYDKAMRPYEAYGTNLLISFYVVALIITLP